MQNKLNICLSFLALVVFTVFVLVLPPDPGAEVFENRAMESFPQFSVNRFIGGYFFERLELYLLDNTAFRTNFLTFSGIVEHSYGINLTGGAMMVDFGSDDLGIGLVPLDEEYVLILAAAEPQEDLLEEIAPAHNLLGRIVDPSQPFSIDKLFNENAIFYLRYRENRITAARYAEVLNIYKAALPVNIRMFSMLAPVKVEFMGPRYAAVNCSQLVTINYINELLDDRIITVDVHSPLAENAEQYIFFRLDHHWTALGAYFAYLAFAEAAGFTPITIENYMEYIIDGFVGSLAVGTRNRTVLSHPDTIYFYRINDGTTFSMDLFAIPLDLSDACYRIFLGGDRAFFYFTSSNKNGRTLVVVKDSFANALVPWIAPHYETIVMIDPRQFMGSVAEVLSELENVDLLFVNYMPATTMPDLIEQIYNAR
jgi:hypothetical protein